MFDLGPSLIDRMADNCARLPACWWWAMGVSLACIIGAFAIVAWMDGRAK